jgi:hypothetical protein
MDALIHSVATTGSERRDSPSSSESLDLKIFGGPAATALYSMATTWISRPSISMV